MSHVLKSFMSNEYSSNNKILKFERVKTTVCISDAILENLVGKKVNLLTN